MPISSGNPGGLIVEQTGSMFVTASAATFGAVTNVFITGSATFAGGGSTGTQYVTSSQAAPVWITGTIATVAGAPSGTTLVTSTQAAPVWVTGNTGGSSNVAVTASVGLTASVSNFPAVTVVTGNQNNPVWVTGSTGGSSNVNITASVGLTASISNFPATQAVTGTVHVDNPVMQLTASVSNFPATQQVTGTVHVDNPTANVSITGVAVTLPVSQTVIPPLAAFVDTNNSTAVPLGAGAAFTGTATEVLAYGQIVISVQSDQPGAAGGFLVEYSQDGVNWGDPTTRTYSAGNVAAGGVSYMLTVRERFYRIRYQNGGTPQGVFRLQSILRAGIQPGGTSNLQDAIGPTQRALLVRAQLVGKQTTGPGSGSYTDVRVNAAGNLATSNTAVATPGQPAGDADVIGFVQGGVVVAASGTTGSLNVAVPGGVEVTGTVTLGAIAASVTQSVVVLNTLAVSQTNVPFGPQVVTSTQAAPVWITQSGGGSAVTVANVPLPVTSSQGSPVWITGTITQVAGPPTGTTLVTSTQANPVWITGTITQVAGPPTGTTTVTASAAAPVGTTGTINLQGANWFPAGYLRITDEPHSLLVDSFDEGLDTVNIWQAPVAQGGGVAAIVLAGNLILETGNVANGYSYIQTISKFKTTTPGWIRYAFNVQIEFPVSGSGYRFWGAADALPGNPVAGAPLDDGIGFEINTDGKMYAVMYSGGTRVVIQDFSQATGNGKQPTDGLTHNYAIFFRPTVSYWYIDDQRIYAAADVLSNVMSDDDLFETYVAIAGSPAPATSLKLMSNAVSVSDTGKNNIQISDGRYPFRKATVITGSAGPSGTDSALVVAISPNTPPVQVTGTVSVGNTPLIVDHAPGASLTVDSFSGPLGITGSVTASIPAPVLVTSSLTFPVWVTATLIGVTGSVIASIPGTVAVSQTNVPTGPQIVTSSQASPVWVTASYPTFVSSTQAAPVWVTATYPTFVTSTQALPLWVTASYPTFVSSTSGAPVWVTRSIPEYVTSSQAMPLWVTGTQLGVTGTVTVAGTATITSSQGNPVAVTGVQAISNFPAVTVVTGNVAQPVWVTATLLGITGSVTATVLGTVTVSQSNVPFGPQVVTSSQASPVWITGTSLGVTGTVTGSVGITNFPATQTVHVDNPVTTVTDNQGAAGAVPWPVSSTQGSVVTASIPGVVVVTGTQANPVWVTQSGGGSSVSVTNVPLPVTSTQASPVWITQSGGGGAVSVTNVPLPVTSTQASPVWITQSGGGSSVSITNVPLPVTSTVGSPVIVAGTASVRTFDQSGLGIASISMSDGTNGLMMAIGGTNFALSPGNSTTAQLGAGATFTGAIESIISAPSISILLISDQNGTLTINQYISASAGSITSQWAFPVTANQGFSRAFTANGNFFNLTFQNTGGSPTTTLNINVYYGNLFPATNLGNLPVSVNEVNGFAVTGSNVPVSGNVGIVGTALVSVSGIMLEGTDNDTESVSSTGALAVEAYPMVFNGTTWDRLRGTIAGGVAVSQTNVPFGPQFVTSTQASPVWVTQSVPAYVTSSQGAPLWITGTQLGITGSATVTASAGNPVGVRTQPAANAAVTNVDVTGSSVQLLAANPARLGATISNMGGVAGTGNLYVKFGTAAAVLTSYTVRIAVNGYYEVPYGYTGVIHGICSGSQTTRAMMTEITP